MSLLQTKFFYNFSLHFYIITTFTKGSTQEILLFAGLSNPPLAPHNNQYNREANCIEQADESAALPIFVFMVAQVRAFCAFFTSISLADYFEWI